MTPVVIAGTSSYFDVSRICGLRSGLDWSRDLGYILDYYNYCCRQRLPDSYTLFCRITALFNQQFSFTPDQINSYTGTRNQHPMTFPAPIFLGRWGDRQRSTIPQAPHASLGSTALRLLFVNLWMEWQQQISLNGDKWQLQIGPLLSCIVECESHTSSSWRPRKSFTIETSTNGFAKKAPGFLF